MGHLRKSILISIYLYMKDYILYAHRYININIQSLSMDYNRLRLFIKILAIIYIVSTRWSGVLGCVWPEIEEKSRCTSYILCQLVLSRYIFVPNPSSISYPYKTNENETNYKSFVRQYSLILLNHTPFGKWPS